MNGLMNLVEREESKMSIVIKPPTKLLAAYGSASVFLAGSIEMGKADNWQARIEQLLPDNVVVFNPRRDDWDSSWEEVKSNPQFREQVEWELNALEESDVIIMHFVPDTMSPISLLEFGLYARNKKLFVSCPKGFWRKGNVDITSAKYGLPVYENIDELLLEFYL